jgi:hypothetical protein
MMMLAIKLRAEGVVITDIKYFDENNNNVYLDLPSNVI